MIKPKDLQGWRRIERNEIWYAVEYHKRFLKFLTIINLIIQPIGLLIIVDSDGLDLEVGLFCLPVLLIFWLLTIKDYIVIRLGWIKVLDVSIKSQYLDPKGCPYPPTMTTKYGEIARYGAFYVSKQPWLDCYDGDIECLFFLSSIGKIIAIKREART